MWRIIVKVFVEIFVPKHKRVNVKAYLLSLRARAQVKRTAKHVGKNFYCNDGGITVTRNTSIGDEVQINGLRVIGDGDLDIGNHVVIASECMIITDSHNYDGTMLPFDNTVCKTKGVKIADLVWIGARVTILPGTEIGEGAIIQGGGVIHGKIPPCAIAGGNPAKVFKYRDIELYNDLKKKNAVKSVY